MCSNCRRRNYDYEVWFAWRNKMLNGDRQHDLAVVERLWWHFNILSA